MDLIRSKNIILGDIPVNLNFVQGLYNPIILDDRGGSHQPLTATISVTQRVKPDEIMAINQVVYDQVEVKLTWREGPLNVYNNSQNQNKIKTLILREDYFRRTTVGG